MFDKDKTSILIATFSPWIKGVRLPINGNLEPMRDYFTPKTFKTVIIDQPYPGSDFVIPNIELYEKGKLKNTTKSSFFIYLLFPLLKFTNKGGTNIFFKMRDFFSVVDWSLRDNPYDFFIGFEAINALGGILMRKFGKVKKVIYYVSDYSPKRYKNKLFNLIYIWLDRLAAYNCDFIWDVSKAMHPARIRAGLNPTASAPVINVPNALYKSQINYLPEDKIKKYSLVFIGTLGKENGPDLAIEALPLVLKEYKSATLKIVGGDSENLPRLKKLAKNLGVYTQVNFHGFIADREKISNEIKKYMVALAPYLSIPGSARFYGDATKIRAYLAAGLPTITTFVPPLGKEAEKKGAAIVVPDSKEELAKAILKVFKDRELYLNLRKNAIKFSKKNTWENEFNKAFKKIYEKI